MFTDIMSKYPCETDAVKLYHLEKALTGKAVGAIDQQTLKDNNYAGAWKILTDRFENRRTIIDIHSNGILNLKCMTKATASDLSSTVADCVRHVESLKFHQMDLTGMSESLVINLLASKLDIETRKLWESTIEHGQLPSYENTVKFLQARCSVLERIEASESNASVVVAKQRATTNKSSAGKAHTAVAAETVHDNSCDICRSNHAVHRRNEFKAMSVESQSERFEALFQLLAKESPDD